MKKSIIIKPLNDETNIDGPMMVYREKSAKEEKQQSDFFLKLRDKVKAPKSTLEKLPS